MANPPIPLNRSRCVGLSSTSLRLHHPTPRSKKRRLTKNKIELRVVFMVKCSMKKLSRQRKLQLWYRNNGCCQACGQPKVNKNFCEFHRALNAERSLARYHKTHPPELKRARLLQKRISKLQDRLALLERELAFEKKIGKP